MYVDFQMNRILFYKGDQLAGIAKCQVINFPTISVNANCQVTLFVQLLVYFMETGLLLYCIINPLNLSAFWVSIFTIANNLKSNLVI